MELIAFPGHFSFSRCCLLSAAHGREHRLQFGFASVSFHLVSSINRLFWPDSAPPSPASSLLMGSCFGFFKPSEITGSTLPV